MRTEETTQPTHPARERLREYDRNGEFPPSWRPNPGDEVTGEVLRYSATELKLSGPCQVCTIGQEDGEPLSVFITGAVLVGEFEKKNPKLGETITVRFVGKNELKGYKKFVLYVHREEEEITDFRQAAGIKTVAGKSPDPADDDVFSDDDPGSIRSTPYADVAMR